MKPLSQEEKQKLLSKLYWDKAVDPEHLLRLLDGTLEGESEFEHINLYTRLLTSCDWYTILKLVPTSKLRALLDDKVLATLYPKDLKKRFQYARSILSK